MKFSKFGRICLALAVSLGTGLGVTSCSTDHAVGYFYVTGSQYNQVSAFRIDNNLGELTVVPNSPFASGGVNPVKVLTANAGKFLYVLNAGCGGTSQIACPTGTAADETGANVSLFTIGGKGALSFQAAYTSQGNNPISIQTDSSGTHLFVLDSTVAVPTDCPYYIAGNSATICGDITSFNIDPNTGRLSLITNQGVKNGNGTNLPYFPVGSGPINFYVAPSNSFIYTIEKGSGDQPKRSSSGGLYIREQQRPVDLVAEYAPLLRCYRAHLHLHQRQENVYPDRCPKWNHTRRDPALHHRHQTVPF